MNYRGRIAPSPTGLLHLGHAATFSAAMLRAEAHKGVLIYRDEDIDTLRCKPEFSEAAVKDLYEWGLRWDEGPDKSGPHQPYIQSQRTAIYLDLMNELFNKGAIYPSPHSRSEINAMHPRQFEGEAIFPSELRMPTPHEFDPSINWRFRVPDGNKISFTDNKLGEIAYTAERDFGDFLVWRKDQLPAYELAVVVDDHLMQITEVVRGADLLLSTARQILIYQALGWMPPEWFHAPLIVDQYGQRLAKTVSSLSIKEILLKGYPPSHDFLEIQTLAIQLAKDVST